MLRDDRLSVIAQCAATTTARPAPPTTICAIPARVCLKVDQDSTRRPKLRRDLLHGWANSAAREVGAFHTAAWRLAYDEMWRQKMRATAFRTLLCAAAFAAIAPAVLAQAYQPPRTPDGRPDLQGMWTNSSITMLERNNASLPLFLNPEQVAGMEGQRLQQEVSQNSRTNPDEDRKSVV
jgi:hypothetical protein